MVGIPALFIFIDAMTNAIKATELTFSEFKQQFPHAYAFVNWALNYRSDYQLLPFQNQSYSAYSFSNWAVSSGRPFFTKAQESKLFWLAYDKGFSPAEIVKDWQYACSQFFVEGVFYRVPTAIEGYLDGVFMHMLTDGSIHT